MWETTGGKIVMSEYKSGDLDKRAVVKSETLECGNNWRKNCEE